MAINLERIEEELKRQREEVQRLEDIKRILSDPKSAALVEDMIRSGDGGHREEANPNVQGDRDLDGASQASIIRQIVSRQAGRFTVGSIGDEVRALGIEITNIAVGRVLQRMNKKQGAIRIARRGGGGASPNWYELAEGGE